MLRSTGQDDFGARGDDLGQLPEVLDDFVAIDPIGHLVETVKDEEEAAYPVQLLEHGIVANLNPLLAEKKVGEEVLHVDGLGVVAERDVDGEPRALDAFTL